MHCIVLGVLGGTNIEAYLPFLPPSLLDILTKSNQTSLANLIKRSYQRWGSAHHKQSVFYVSKPSLAVVR